MSIAGMGIVYPKGTGFVGLSIPKIESRFLASLGRGNRDFPE